jgi:tRNA 2-selenouridine synthase
MLEFKELFRRDTPLIDVRAPVEFHEGHFPGSTNLPLMNDTERAAVGTRYKEAGQAEALKLGHELVSGALKESRIDAWEAFLRQHPEANLYCFRGGLRSQISVSWIAERGLKVPFIPGGYKALRRFLLETLEQESQQRKFLVVGGRTGSGKTLILDTTPLPALDLEGAANHKGSSFGKMGPQPAQITFENRVAIQFLKHNPAPVTLVEDESVMIGSCIVPRTLKEKMNEAPILLLEVPIEDRIRNTFEGYVLERFHSHGGNRDTVAAFMRESLERISKKLGGLETSRIRGLIDTAFALDGPPSLDAHAPWIEALLLRYYDPLYDKSIAKNLERVAFRGNTQACIEYLKGLK